MAEVQENELNIEEKETKAEFIKCESCGGNMIFDPITQMLTCEHCNSKISFDKNKEVQEIAIEKAFNATDVWNETAVMRCENCGAMINVDRDDVALECPYCGTGLVRRIDELAGVKPNALYPFTIDKPGAEIVAKKWARGLIFSPRKFKKTLEAKNLKGVYQPCWTFDSQTTTGYNGRLGKRKTRTVHTKNGTRTETYIQWYNVSGNISLGFDDISVSASTKIEQKKLTKLMPFRQNTICVYEKKYLAGFMANHYDKDIKSSWGEAKSIMEQKIRDAILRKYDCDVVGSLNTSTIHSNVTYKYVLLPIYVLNYQFKKKLYEVNINGNTGRVCGKAPISFWRVLLAILIGAGILVGAWFLFQSSEGSDVEIIMDMAKNFLPIK